MDPESRWYSVFRRLNQNFMKIRITLPELYQASKAPQIKNPKGEEPLEKNLPWREEPDDQKKMTPMTGLQREESRTSVRARNKSQTPLPQIAGGGCRKAATDNFDPHYEEGTQQEKATQRAPPIAPLESAQKGQKAETLRARKRPQGEGSPGSQPQKEAGQEEGRYSPGRESQQGQAHQTDQLQGYACTHSVLCKVPSPACG